jgi:predicted transcriptional regulator YheO
MSSYFWMNNKLIRFLKVLVPGILIIGLTLYAVSFRSPTPVELKVLPGKALAAYEELYPIRADANGALYLDKDRFSKAVDYLTSHPSPRAIADLLYLGNSNNVTLLLDQQSKTRYIYLTELPEYVSLPEVDRQKDKIFQTYKDIVNGVGATLAGTPVEIVLHDTRNPLRSIVAVQNSISGRKIGDTNTNFGVQLIKNYSLGEGQGQGVAFVSYPLTLKDGRAVKSTTIPLFHEVYGLVGFICINIDISKMDKMKNPEMIDRFVENFKSTSQNDAISEMIQNSKKSN